MRIRRAWMWTVITLTGGAVSTLACGDGDADGPEGTAEVRVVHAAAGAPAVDVYLAGDGEPVVAGLAYGEASGFAQLPAGELEFEIRPAGAEAASEAIYSTGPLTVPAGARIDAIAAGRLDASGDDDAFRVLTLVEEPVSASDAALVRIVHAGADAPAVAIDVGNDGSAEIEDLARFGDTGGQAIELPADTELRVGILAGLPLQPVTYFTLPPLPAGHEALIVAAGLLSADAGAAAGFSLLAFTPTASARIAQDPLVYALHAGPDAPAVDLYTPDTQPLALGLGFGDLSAGFRVAPRSQVINVWPAGIEHGAAPAASATTPALVAGQRYLVIASGFLAAGEGEQPFGLIAAAAEFDREDAAARVRIVHASPDAPAVDVGTVHGDALGALLATDLRYGQSTPGKGVSVTQTPVDLGVAATGSAAIAARFNGLAIEAGARLFAVAAGALAPAAGREGFRLIVVDAGAPAWTAAAVHPN
ncbi:MAG TPA: DUF4397 domain-containing protein, partial [Kofleriaceae bacterium]|nr:DUF4397 domain-containing protein [Kofleriaceae bacterium]